MIGIDFFLKTKIGKVFKLTMSLFNIFVAKIVEDISPIVTKAATPNSKDYKQKLG